MVFFTHLSSHITIMTEGPRVIFSDRLTSYFVLDIMTNVNLKAPVTLPDCLSQILWLLWLSPPESALKWGEHWLSLLQTMAPLFPSLGRLLKETPIREASISGVRPRGHAQVQLLFMSAKPIKTLQPPTRLAF